MSQSILLLDSRTAASLQSSTHINIHILGAETWSSSSDARKLNFLLYGIQSVNYDANCAFFREVQSFIINTNRFSVAAV